MQQRAAELVATLAGPQGRLSFKDFVRVIVDGEFLDRCAGGWGRLPNGAVQVWAGGVRAVGTGDDATGQHLCGYAEWDRRECRAGEDR